MSSKRFSAQAVANAGILALTLGAGIYLLHAAGVHVVASSDPGSPAVGAQLRTQQSRWEAHDETLVLAMRRGCHFCEESMPFYRQLASLQNSQRLKAHLVAELPDDPVSTNFLLKSQDLQIEAVSDVPLDEFAINGTPTLVLVNRYGTVQRVWSGKLSRRQEEDLLHTIER